MNLRAAYKSMGWAESLEVLDRWLNPDHIRLHAGEMTAQEMRSVIAVLRAIRSEIAELK